MHIRFEDYSKEVNKTLNSAIIAGLYAAAGEVQGQVARNVPVDSGQLRNSWSYVVDEEKLIATIGSPLENAIWNEFGTGEYALHGDGRKGGWSYKDEKGKWHYTYGKRPNRSLYNAFLTKKSSIKTILESNLRELNTGNSKSANKKSKTNNKTSSKNSSVIKNVKKIYNAVKNPKLPSLPLEKEVKKDVKKIEKFLED